MKIAAWLLSFGIVIFGIAVPWIYSVVLQHRMVAQVNAALPADQRYSHYWWSSVKSVQLNRDYREHFPQGDLARRIRLATLIVILSFISMMIVPVITR
jgi:hypothetical protein